MAKEIVVNLKASAKVENREQINELRRSLKKAQEDVDLYKSKWEETLNEISELKERLEGVKNVSGIKILEQELETFRLTAQRSQKEFTTFLKSVNLDTMEFRSLDAVQEMIDNLGKGLITVNQAVAQVKSSFGFLMEDSYKNGSGAFNADIVKTFATTLDGLTKSMDVVLQKLSQFETDGVKAAGGGGGGGLGNIAETFKQIAVGAEALSERASGSLNAISELVSAINSYANVDSTKLLAVSNAFGNIAAIGGHNFSENSVKNIINLATELSALNRNGDFNFRFDLTGINGVTISKTIRYLTEYLPGLSNNTNFDNLAKISSISFANLSSENLKVSKATIANLMELIQTMSGNASKEDAFSQYDYGAGQAAQTVTQELQQASVAVKDAGAAVRDNLSSMPQQAKTAEAAITGYADKVEAEMQRISKAIEKSYNLDALTAKLKRGDLDIIRQALQTGVGGGDPFAALETLAGSKTQLARTSDYIKTGLGNPVLMELNNVREQYETFIKYIDNDYSDLYNKFNALALLFKGFSGGKDNLQISGQDLYGKIDTSKIPFASYDAFQSALRGASINYPNLANYSTTLGLDSLNLKGVEDQSERIRAAAELAVAAKREEATAVAGVSEALASGSQSATDHSRVMEQNVAATKAVVAASKEEKAAFSDGNQAKKEDAAAAEAAAKAEEEKRKISELLAEALKREEEATNGTSSSAAKHTDVIKQQEDAMWEAYRAEQGMHNKSAAETEAEVDREIAAYNKRLDAQQAAADKAQKAWEKEEAAAMAAADKKADAEERATQRKIKAAEDAAAKIAASEQKAAEAAIKRTAYDDAKRAVNQYYDLLSDQNKDPSKRADVVMTDAGWASKSGLYAGFAQQLNDATAAFNMLTDAQNKNNLSGQQVAAINELIATRQKDYALAVENTAAKEAEHAQKSEELTQKKQAEAEAARAAKEAKQQEAEATKAQAQAERDAAKAAKEAEQNANRKKNYILQLNNLLVKCEGAERKYAAASKLSNARDNYEGIQRTKEEVQKLLVELEKESPDLDRVAAGLRNCTTEYSKNSAALQTNNSLVGRWVTNGMQQLKSRLQYSLGLAAVVYKAVGEVKKMVSTAVELDSAMNTLQIVTRASGAEMDEYGKRVSSMAKETAQATKDLIDATTVYARLGYSMDESATLSKYTAMLEGVGGIEASAAQDAVTAIIKAFGKNVNDIEDVMNKLVLVGNNFPISVSQLAEGMNNAGSMLAVAGNSFEQSIALLTAANTTIQNISKASTGLRTIAARIRKTTTGEGDDGEIVEEAKYQEMVNALTKQHVSLIDEATGQYRSTYDIIKDIARVWKDMTSMEQAAVVEALAGTRQQNIFASLMTQFGEAEEAMRRMDESSGELQESYDIYLGSIQAHIQTLKAAYDELARDFVNSDFAKGVIDFLTKIIECIDFITSHLGSLGTAVAALGSIGVLKGIAMGDVALGFVSLAKAIGSLLTTAAPVALFVGTITALVLIAKKFNEEYQKTHPTTEQLASDFQKAKGEADRLAKQIEVNTKRLEELNEIRGTEEWTKELEAERAGLEEQNLKLKEQLGLLEDIAKYKQEAYNGRLNGDIDKYFNTGREVYNPVGLEGNNGGELYTHKATEGYGYLWNSVDEYKKALEELEELEERRRNHDWSSEKEAEQLNQDIINKNLDVANYAQRIEDERARLIAWRDSLAESTDEESLKNIGRINVALDKISKETGKNVKSFDDFKSKIKSLSDDALKYLTGESKNAEKAQKELTTWLKKSGYSANEAAQYFVQYAKELKESASAGEQAAKSTIADLAGVADEGDRALQVWEKYQKAMEAGERDDLLKNYQQAWQDAIDDIENNRIDSQKVHAAIDLFIPRETQRALGNNMRKMGEYLSSDFFRAIWESSDEDERTVAQKAFEYIRDNLTREDGVWVSGNNLSYESIEKFAAALKIPVEAATTVLKQLDIYGVGVYNSIQDNAALIDSFVALKNTLGSTEKAIDQTVRELAERYDRLDIHQILGDLQENGVIDIDTTTLHQKIDEVYDTIDQTDEESAEPDVILNIDSVIENAENVTTILKALDGYTAHTFITSEYLPPAGDPTTVNSNGFSGTSGKIGTSSSTGPSGHSTSTHAGAHGKSRGEGGGDTLVNELGPELISDQGKAFIANGGKPGFVKLSADAIVFTAEETKDILRGKRNVNGKALAQGSVGRGSLIGKLFRGRVKARAYKVCGNCGATLSATASRCPNCGSFVLITKQDYGASNAGVNRSAYGSPTASNTQNMGGNGYYYNPSNGNTYYARPNGNGTSTIITYTTTTSESSIAQAQQAEEYAYIASITAQLKRDTEQLKAENAALRAKAEGKGNESIFGNGQKNQSLGSGLAGSGGGNYVGGADYRSYSEPQKVDWVAVRINRLQRTIADLEKIASSGFKKLDTRLRYTKDQITNITDELKVQKQAYDRYIQEANSVGLSESIAANVREGTIDITKYDDDTRKKIDEYTEWFEKALDAKSALEELHQNIAQLYVDSFDMVQTDFENQLAQIEHDANMTSKNLEMAQTKGYLDSATFYEQLVSNQADQVNRLNMELTELNQKFKEAMDSGEIEENSEAWHTMTQSIHEVEEAIADANIQLVQYQRTIRQLDWSYFDYAQERFSQMTAEAQFFVDLMSNHELFQDNGQFNNLGEATAGMHAVNYDVYMAQADEYAKQIQKIQKDLESDPYDTELIERREQLLELQRQSILSAEGEKNAVKDLVQNGINLELQALKDLIDAYNDSLDSAKDLYEYQKSITEKTADIASIQKQLSAYQNDASEETRARVQKLTQNLEKAQTELRETEWDRSISDQKKLLDDMYDEYEDYLNQRLDNIDLLMQEMITGTNINMDSIRNTLIDVGEEVGYTMTDQMTQALSADLNYYEHMSGEINSVQVVLSNIYDMVAAMARASGAVKAYATGGLVDYTGLAAVHGSKGKPELMLNASDTANFLEAAKMMREMAGSSISIPSTSGFGNGGGMTIGQLQVNIPIDRVLDYNDLISQLRDDPKFERLVNAMTLDRAVGKSAFGKNKIVF